MTYTTLHTTGAVRLQMVRPITKEMVRISVSSDLHEYETRVPAVVVSLLGNLALSGTEKRSKDALASYLKKNGILLSVSTNGHMITYELATEPAQLKKAVSILTEIICESKIPKQEFTTERARAIESIREEKDDAKYVANILMSSLLYPQQSRHYIPSLDIQKKQLEAATHRTVTTLANAVVRGAFTITAVGGDDTQKALRPLVLRLSRSAEEPTRSRESYTPKSSKATYSTIPSQTNIEVRIGNHLPLTWIDPDFIPLAFGMNVLGKVGGFSGRLMSTVREKEGLTYGIYAQIAEYPQDTSYWYVYTFFMAKDLTKGIASTMREIRQIVKEGITEQELVTFKELLKNQFLLSHESNARILKLYHGSLCGGKTEEDIRVMYTRIESLSKKEVDAALKTYLDPDTVLMSGAGPVTKNGKGIIA